MAYKLSDNPATINGLNLNYPDGGLGTNLQTLVINPGNISFDETLTKQYATWGNRYTYKTISDYTIPMPSNSGNYGVLVSIFVYPDFLIKFDSSTYGLKFQLQIGTHSNDPELPSDLEGAIFLGVVFLPGMFPSINNRLYFRSLNESNTETKFAISSADFLNKSIQDVEEWESKKLYFKKQMVRENNTLWLCRYTHASTISFSFDKTYFWLQIGGTGAVDCDTVLECIFYDVMETNYGRDYIVTYMNVPGQRAVAVSSRRA